jgi:hypothetical protein
MDPVTNTTEFVGSPELSAQAFFPYLALKKGILIT